MKFPAITKKFLGIFARVPARLFAPPHHRRCRLYCVGTPKSGTHSIAQMFAGDIRCQHEPGHKQFVHKIMAVAAGKIADPQLRSWIRKRDRQLNLDVDSSTLNYFIMEQLAQEFGDARFVLTIRDCYSWLNSIANHGVRRARADKHWREFRAFRFRPDLVHAPTERVFKEKGLYTVEGYLSYWAWHNEQALTRVPADRLLVIRTDEITQRAVQIAEFAGLTSDFVRPETHFYRNRGKRDILHEIDRDFVESKVDQYCRPLMQRFFPDITSLEQAHL